MPESRSRQRKKDALDVDVIKIEHRRVDAPSKAHHVGRRAEGYY